MLVYAALVVVVGVTTFVSSLDDIVATIVQFRAICAAFDHSNATVCATDRVVLTLSTKAT
jgi:hypothetical protein